MKLCIEKHREPTAENRLSRQGPREPCWKTGQPLHAAIHRQTSNPDGRAAMGRASTSNTNRFYNRNYQKLYRFMRYALAIPAI